MLDPTLPQCRAWILAERWCLGVLLSWGLKPCIFLVWQMNCLVCGVCWAVGRAVVEGVVGRVVTILPSFVEICSILYRNTGKVETPWISVSRKLVLVTKLLCVVSLLSRTAVLVAVGMAVVTADRGKCIEMCAYLSVIPAVSGMQQLADHSKERRM